MAEELLKSAYEVARDLRLQRNREIMQQLGLLSVATSVAANPASEADEEEASARGEAPAGKKKGKRVKREPAEGSRKSKRLQGLDAEGVPLPEQPERPVRDEGYDIELDETARMHIKIARLKQLHEERQTAYKNPTATYEHTWMRVRTMNDKALERRINVIERALGQHCVVKMRMFAEVLLLANKEELAHKAKEALEHLLALGLSELRSKD